MPSTVSTNPGHKRIFQIVMYTTGSLGYACTQFVAQVT